jgi:hypothetical protein
MTQLQNRKKLVKFLQTLTAAQQSQVALRALSKENGVSIATGTILLVIG